MSVGPLDLRNLRHPDVPRSTGGTALCGVTFGGHLEPAPSRAARFGNERRGSTFHPPVSRDGDALRRQRQVRVGPYRESFSKNPEPE